MSHFPSPSPDFSVVPATPVPPSVAARVPRSVTPEALLERFARFGVELGLERIQRVLAALDNPQRQVPVIHVAGSNGKGSVCAYLSAVLTHAGYRVGRYTSPHLVDWTERICLNEVAIAPDTFEDTLQTVIAAIDPHQPSPTQFEVITAAAWLYFAQQQVDVAVMEVGLGGRLDATNVSDRPLVSVITSLSLEHWQRLGPTLADITREKAGILKPGCPAVIAPQPPEAQAVLRPQLAQLGCPVIWAQPARPIDGETVEWQQSTGAMPPATAAEPNPTVPHPSAAAGTPAALAPLTYALPLAGTHQRLNSAVAIATLRVLQAQGWQLNDQQILAGLARTRWPGRMQWLTWHGRPLLIDGAHNAAGAAMLRRYLDEGERPPTPTAWVLGLMANKDHADIFRALLRAGDRLYLVPVPGHLSADPHSLIEVANTQCPQLAHAAAYPDAQHALAAATSEHPQGTLVLCGSLYLIGHFLRQYRESPDALNALG